MSKNTNALQEIVFDGGSMCPYKMVVASDTDGIELPTDWDPKTFFKGMRFVKLTSDGTRHNLHEEIGALLGGRPGLSYAVLKWMVHNMHGEGGCPFRPVPQVKALRQMMKIIRKNGRIISTETVLSPKPGDRYDRAYPFYGHFKQGADWGFTIDSEAHDSWWADRGGYWVLVPKQKGGN